MSSASSDVHTAAGALDGQRTLPQLQSTPVSALFFSAKNLEALQQGIRYRVWVETGGRHVIDNQSELQLVTIMRALYLQYTNDQPFNVVHQVRELNAHVLDFSVQRIVTELESRVHYMHDISKLPVPLARAPLASSKGDKQLELRSFFGPGADRAQEFSFNRQPL